MKKDYWKRFDTGSGLRGRGLGPVFFDKFKKMARICRNILVELLPILC